MTVITANAAAAVLRVYVMNKFLSLLLALMFPARGNSPRRAWNIQKDGAPADLVSPEQHGVITEP